MGRANPYASAPSGAPGWSFSLFVMSNLTAVQRLYAALAQGDHAIARELFAPEIEWIHTAGFPGGGRHVGAEAVVHEVFDQHRDDWTEWQAVVHQWLEMGDTVVALGEYRGTSRETARFMTAAFAHVYDLQDGKIIRFREYADTAHIRDALPPHVHTRPI